jgi:DNA-binding NarL/FixJ family response regulator
MKPLRTVIIDDEHCSCERLRRLLMSFEFIGETWCCTNSLKGAKIISEQKPEIIFMDVELENTVSGFEVLENIHEKSYHPFVIMVTGHPQYSIKAIRHGVFDYIIKPVDIDELKASLERLLQKTANNKIRINGEFSCLSNRERDILLLVLEGRSSEEIADSLFISVNTVNTHRRNILRKTGARSVLDLYKINSIVHA